MKIDPSLRGSLPRVAPPVPWQSKDGLRNGWKVTIPGQRPLATPAVADGRVFLGGGFGSYDFYALDAATGHVLWQYQTEDDGPTAAVVHAGHVAFTTESCELEVLSAAGRPLWKQWLGDPLMSMPAMADGRVYHVYPDSRGAPPPAAPTRSTPPAGGTAATTWPPSPWPPAGSCGSSRCPARSSPPPCSPRATSTSPTWTGCSPASARATAARSGRRQRAPPH